MKLKTIVYSAVIAAVAGAFVVGSGGIGYAKKKKAEAAPPPAICQIMPHKQVCGARGSTRTTYANSCYAAHDGAKVVSQGACKTHVSKTRKAAAKPAKKEMKK